MSLLQDLDVASDLAKDRGYYELIESHLAYLKKLAATTVRTIAPLDAAVYKGDFYGLLYYLGVEKKYHYPIMRINDLNNSSDYDGINTQILFPPEDVVSSFVTIYESEEVN